VAASLRVGLRAGTFGATPAPGITGASSLLRSAASPARFIAPSHNPRQAVQYVYAESETLAKLFIQYYSDVWECSNDILEIRHDGSGLDRLGSHGGALHCNDCGCWLRRAQPSVFDPL